MTPVGGNDINSDKLYQINTKSAEKNIPFDGLTTSEVLPGE
jgi:hypothetical protein